MRHESPIKRRNPSGEMVWLARYTGRDGKRRVAKPAWNRGKGTFGRKGEAQKAIDEAYGLSDRPDTLGDYFETWTERHPRSERTNDTYNHRIGRVADVVVEGIALRDWPLRDYAAATPSPWSITCSESKAEPRPAPSASCAHSRRWPRTQSPTKSATSTP